MKHTSSCVQQLRRSMQIFTPVMMEMLTLHFSDNNYSDLMVSQECQRAIEVKN